MKGLSLFSPGALVWLPASAKRVRWSSDLQLELFPKEYSLTKVPLIGVLKGYTDRGQAEVLFQDGIWDVEPNDLFDYNTDKQRRYHDRVSTNQET